MSEVRDVVRKSLPLTASDVRDLAFMRDSSEYRRALHEMTGVEIDEGTSEAAYLHAVLDVGLKALREHAEDSGYAAIAAEQGEASTRRRTARRRVPAWANE